jgi:hypothetical protein
MHHKRLVSFAVVWLFIISGLFVSGCGDDDKGNNPAASTSLPGTWAPVGTGIGIGSSGLASALFVSGDTLFFGGYFDSIDNIHAHNIAAWHDSSWGPLGAGVTGGTVMALTTHSGYVVAGGAFDHAGGASANHIALWDGSSWGTLGSGRGTAIFALAEFLTALFTGGNSGTNGGLSFVTGMGWTTLASNITVRALTVYNDTLIIGGTFSDFGNDSGDAVFAFNGMNSSSLGSGIAGSVYALAVYDGRLIAGGSFTSAGGVTANNIAAWDGSSWTPLGSGINGPIVALTVWNNQLVVGGSFSTAGGISAKCIAAWNGSAWKSLGSGVDGVVWAVTTYGTKLVAAGEFTSAGGVAARGIAAWTPQ